MTSYDVIIVGGGPGGSSAAYFHSQKGKKVLLLEKSQFPKDKVCGDAVTGKALNILSMMGVLDELQKEKSISSNSILLSSPKGFEIDIPLSEPEDPLTAFCIERERLDIVIFNKAKESVIENEGKIIENFSVKEVLFENDKKGDENKIIGIKGVHNNNEYSYNAPLIIGAGGYNCPIARAIIMDNYEEVLQDRKHYSAAFREYWTDVKDCEGKIEIHFIDEIQPGYFWIFPVGENKVNVGIGMLMCEMDKTDIKLKKMQEWIINHHPKFSKRFENAKLIPKSSKGWILPMGSPRKNSLYQPRRAFMRGALLIGDAASLIDPFTGEGIGNALVSGMLTTSHDSGSLKDGMEYQHELWDTLGKELSNSDKLQKLLKHKWLINWFFKKASKKETLQLMLTEMLTNKKKQSEFNSKWFIFKTLLF